MRIVGFTPRVRPSHLAVAGLLLSVSVVEAVPIRTLPDLVSVSFWERTGGLGPAEIVLAAVGPEMTARRMDSLSETNRDFFGTPVEHYDVFYSNADGNFNLDGSYITVEATFPLVAPGGGGLNIAAVGLNFSASPTLLADVLASFVALGDNGLPATALNAVDGDLLTHTTMGNTVGNSGRLRVTLGFSTVPEPSTGLLFLCGAVLLHAVWRRG